MLLTGVAARCLVAFEVAACVVGLFCLGGGVVGGFAAAMSGQDHEGRGHVA